MKLHRFFSTALILTTALFCSGKLSAQWSQSATAIYPTTLTKNVGIGTSTPTNANLQFGNTLGNKITLFDNGNNSAYGFGITDYNLNAYVPVGSRFSVRTGSYNGAEKFVVTSDGKVGIGTSTPNNALQVNGAAYVNTDVVVRKFLYVGDDATNNGTTDIRFGSNNAGTGEGIGSKRTAGGNQNGLDFYTGNVNRLCINKFGNVGIGTISPAAKLHVAQGNLHVDTGFGIEFGDQVLNNPPHGKIWENAADSRMIIRAGGYGAFPEGTVPGWLEIQANVGIGTGNAMPGYKLQVAGDIRCYTLFSNSDRRYKTDIKTLDGALDKILAMRGTSYNLIAEKLPEGYTPGKQVGFIAQEMKTVMPELVKEDSEGMMAVNYIGVIPVLVEALKEQHELVTTLQAQNNELQSRLDAIEAALGIANDRKDDAKAAVHAKISPNPSNGLVNVELQNTASVKSMVVNMVDAFGRQVSTRTVAAGTSSVQFDLSQFPTGIYVVQIIADGQTVSSNKVQLVK